MDCSSPASVRCQTCQWQQLSTELNRKSCLSGNSLKYSATHCFLLVRDLKTFDRHGVLNAFACLVGMLVYSECAGVMENSEL